MDIRQWLINYFSKEANAKVKELEDREKEMQSLIITAETDLNNRDYLIEELNTNITALKNEIKQLNTTIELLGDSDEAHIPDFIKNKCEEIKNEYPQANITYTGYTIKLNSKTITPAIDITDFIHVLNSHKKWCEKYNYTLKDYLCMYPDLEFGKVINKLMFDIYKKYLPTKSYVYDSTLYGIGEQWSPLIDSWYLKKMDCENSTFELMALFEAAGLTGELRSLYWNVCGQTELGGHSTLYAYDLQNNKWRHMETTATSTSCSTFYGLPFNTDTKDQLRITDVWFSFNSDIARHTFKTDASKKAYKKRDKFKNITIS